MAKLIAALVAGLVFGFGLAVSGLANPDKVQQFLIVSANWSPALLFTMATGVLVTFTGYRWVLRRGPVLVDELQMPTNTKLDRRLLVGSGISYKAFQVIADFLAVFYSRSIRKQFPA